MRAVIPVLDPQILEQRKRFGVDQYDEMWDGELHMPPSPDYWHQSFEGELATYLRIHWGHPNKAQVLQQMNLARVRAGQEWRQDYRIPDILLVTPERMQINHVSHFEGAPDMLVEIHSPGDEAHEKLPFYRELTVPEVWIIHRDTKKVEPYLLRQGEYELSEPDADGWVRSPAAGMEMRPTGTGKLAIQLIGKADTAADLPLY
jgi:Uma2 family endonuclease